MWWRGTYLALGNLDLVVGEGFQRAAPPSGAGPLARVGTVPSLDLRLDRKSVV